MSYCHIAYTKQSCCVLQKKGKSGYIMYAAETRREIMNENPGATFAEISRLVGMKVTVHLSVGFKLGPVHVPVV